MLNILEYLRTGKSQQVLTQLEEASDDESTSEGLGEGPDQRWSSPPSSATFRLLSRSDGYETGLIAGMNLHIEWLVL